MNNKRKKILIGALVTPFLLFGCATKNGVYIASDGKEGTKKKATKDEYPTLRPPEASCTKVGEKIEGTRYIGPHIICDIEKPAVWSK